MMPFTPTQLKVLAIVPKIAYIPSLLGALYVVQDAIRKKSRTVYHRLLLLMSLMDWIVAVKFGLSSWPAPQEAQGVWGAKGTVRSCDATGFLGHGAMVASACYNGSLALYFMASIVWGWRNDYIRKWLEPWLHLVPLVIGWTTATLALVWELFNPVPVFCFVAPNPPGCGGGGGGPPCQRGVSHADDIVLYRLVLMHGVVWAVFVLTASTLAVIYGAVQKREAAMEARAFRHESEARRTLARRVAVQAFLYAVLFVSTWVLQTIAVLLEWRHDAPNFALLTASIILAPQQGFFNAIVYVRPRYLRYRRRNTSAGRREAILHAVSATNPEEEEEDYDGEIMDCCNIESTSDPSTSSMAAAGT